ncbi:MULTISPECIES: hypothetical protein [unclassified Archaeoglobus]|uniref:hypothetical protein n=1 Tax=unclassified Archaeoglobus TaxID=2643606 RepID=UPI0025C15EF9|nr:MULTISPECIES: hypothetical protein [unclassified Archaeoglobus]
MSDVTESVKIEGRRVKVQVYLTEREYKAFKEALEKSGKYYSMSDAIRYFVRRFIDEIEKEEAKKRLSKFLSNNNGSSFVDADGDVEVFEGGDSA